MTMNGHRKKWTSRLKLWRAERNRRKALRARQAASLKLTYEKKADDIRKDLKKADRKIKSTRRDANRSLRKLSKELDRTRCQLKRRWRDASR